MKEETVKCVIGLREKKLILSRKGQGIRNARKKTIKRFSRERTGLESREPSPCSVSFTAGKTSMIGTLNHEEVGLMQMDEYKAM